MTINERHAILTVIDNVLDVGAQRVRTPITTGRTVAEVLPVQVTPTSSRVVIENLVFQDAGLEIGIVEQMECLLPGSTQWAEGHHLLAVARLHDTVLADVSWRPLKAHIFGGVCVIVQGVEIISVILGSVEGSCLPGALILGMWEEATVN